MLYIKSAPVCQEDLCRQMVGKAVPNSGKKDPARAGPFAVYRSPFAGVWDPVVLVLVLVRRSPADSGLAPNSSSFRTLRPLRLCGESELD